MYTLKRLWYRITGQKQLAERIYRLARILDSCSPGHSTRFIEKWQREYGHIAALYEEQS
jgi:hypothetical protein